jgi:hypothetical protein
MGPTAPQNPQHNIPQAVSAPVQRIRFVFLAFVLSLWVGLIAGRLVWLQVFEHHHYMVEAEHFEVAPRRGVLYDRNLRELAMTVLVDSVYAVRRSWATTARRGGDAGEGRAYRSGDNFTSKQQILARFNDSRNFAWVARKLDRRRRSGCAKLNLKGFISRRSSSGSIRTTIWRRRCWAMWARTTPGWAGWSRSSTMRCTASRAHADRGGCQAACDGQRGERARCRARTWC